MNIKKIGLSALAGSLAMVSANAVELAVSGKSEVTYLSHDSNTTTGNPFGFGNAITFTGTGDMNGMTAKYFSVINDGGGAGFLSSEMSLDMGAMGLVAIDQGTGGYGVATIDDKMPYAYEEIWTYTGAANGLRADGGATNVLGYKNTFAGYTLNVEINPGSGATTEEAAAAVAAVKSGDGASSGATTTNNGYNWALTGSPMDGLNVGVGFGKEESTLTTTNAEDTEYATGYVTYAMGGATVGYQMSEGTGGSSGTTSNEAEMYGISFSVNENLAISYNVLDNTFDKAGAAAVDVTEETTGIGASYTMGSASVRLLSAKTDNVGGVQSTNQEVTELSLMLAF
jgi:outer membrane protein OmpU